MTKKKNTRIRSRKTAGAEAPVAPQTIVIQQPAAAPVQKQRINRAIAKTHTSSAKIFGDAAKKEQPSTEVTIKSFEGQQMTDPFKEAYSVAGTTGIQNILKPPYNPYALLKMPEENNMLRQCIDAMVVNIESFGHRLEYIGEEGQDESKEAQAEAARLKSLLDNPNGQYTLLDMRERLRRDEETFGYAYIEVNREDKTKQIISLYHVPAQTMRLTSVDGEDTPTSIPLMRNGKMITQKVNRQFRRYVQEINGKKIFFKEYGDPRTIDPTDGKVNPSLAFQDSASEILMLKLYAPGTAYGAPRWINQLPAILGSRQSEVVNLNFFKQNTIPAMAVLVSGGELTEGSLVEIEEHISAVQGQDSMHRVMLLEAKGDENAASENGTIPAPKIELKPLQADRQSDAMFQEYDKNNQKKIRSSFRLPPLYVGLSEDTTYASAQTAQVIAEGQVFGSERNKIDEVFHNYLLCDETGLAPKFWRFRSNPPRINDPQTLINALTTLNQLGALTPNISIGIANELFDLHIPPIKEAWGDYPMQMVMALANAGTLDGVDTIQKEPVQPDPATTDANAQAAVDNLPVDAAAKAEAKKLFEILPMLTRRDFKKQKAKIYVQ